VPQEIDVDLDPDFLTCLATQKHLTLVVNVRGNHFGKTRKSVIVYRAVLSGGSLKDIDLEGLQLAIKNADAEFKGGVHVVVLTLMSDDGHTLARMVIGRSALSKIKLTRLHFRLRKALHSHRYLCCSETIDIDLGIGWAPKIDQDICRNDNDPDPGNCDRWEDHDKKHGHDKDLDKDKGRGHDHDHDGDKGHDQDDGQCKDRDQDGGHGHDGDLDQCDDRTPPPAETCD